jgi:hypothetical protein
MKNKNQIRNLINDKTLVQLDKEGGQDFNISVRLCIENLKRRIKNVGILNGGGR